ncbi:glycosyltransferase family 2 protein [Brucella pituitosa]|uniref:Glycosyltransferase family 2 protein n=1 Tax=Brucella pituitosa TaxID=571256 RepID=A0A643EVS5_9HYPH|nr:glycosyltransferase [Brucella pituitosa]KAB0566828.1 glycosyltransferase family 2 protein [Brucella pituitosa]
MSEKKIYNTIQRVIFPTVAEIDKSSLFVRWPDGGATASADMFGINLSKGTVLDLSTFFNSFSHKKWLDLTGLQNLSVRFEGTGKFLIKILCYTETAAASNILEKELILSGEESILELPNLDGIDGNIIALNIRSLQEDSHIKCLEWVTLEVPKRAVKLAAVITTFKRELPAQRAIDKFKDVIIPHSPHTPIELFVIDNGQSLDISIENTAIHLIPNPNLGGAGGFARGLKEVQDRNQFTHTLFMDDDAACEPESVWRTCALLSYAHDTKLSVAGGMFHTETPTVQYEKGATLLLNGNGPVWATHYHNRDLSDIAVVASNDYGDWANYGAWWFFAFPLSEISQYPFPFFVRGDDTDFSIANNLRIATMNGIATWCENFGYKVSPSVEYLAHRSWLALALLHGDAEKVKSVYKHCLKHALLMTLRFQYACAHAVLDAIEDVSKGPEFFSNNPAPIEKLSSFKNIYPPLKVTAEDFLKIVPVPRTSPGARRLIGLLTLGGLLLPKSKLRDKYAHTRIPWEAGQWNLLRLNGAVYGVGENLSLFKRDRTALAKVMRRILKARVTVFRNLSHLQSDYKAAGVKIRTKEYWEKLFTAKKG